VKIGLESRWHFVIHSLNVGMNNRQKNSSKNFKAEEILF